MEMYAKWNVMLKEVMENMVNILEAVTNMLQSFVDNEPKAPLHIGEAMNCWMYLGMLEEEISIVQIMQNTTVDDELMEILDESEKLAKMQANKLKTFLQQEGVPLPPASEEKPKSDPHSIPLGAKLTDHEIANSIAVKAVSNIMMCAKGASESVRNDVGLMFIQFLSEKMIFGANLKAKMRLRGWIKVPPYYYPPGLPKQQ